MIDSDFEKRTRRLIIRPYNLSDYENWRETYLNLGRPKNKWDQGPREKSELTKAKFKKLLSRKKKNRDKDIFYDLAAFEKKTGRIVGFSALMDVSRLVFQNAFLGYGVLNHSWGKGFGSELTKATLGIGFRDIKLHRIEAGIEPKNKRSIALARSIGMRRGA